MPHSSNKPNLMGSHLFQLSLHGGIRKRQRQCRLKDKSKGFLRRKRADWSIIDRDLLESISKKFPIVDILQCGAVCSPWRSVAQARVSSSLKSPTSTSLLPPPIIWRRPGCHQSYWFLDVTTPGEVLYQLNESESIFDKLGRCVGFSHGWFIFLATKKKNRNLCLFHPLFCPEAVVSLPRISTPKTHPYSGLTKVVLWDEPVLSRGNFGVVVMHESFCMVSRRFLSSLLFANPGAAKFSELIHDNPETSWNDIICFNNMIYGLASCDKSQHLVAWDCGGRNCSDPPRKVLDFQPKFSDPRGRSTLHLVESKGDLLLVKIQRPDPKSMRRVRKELRLCPKKLYAYARCPNMCRVYKMDFKEQEWVRMDSLGHRALFIMETQNVSVSCHEFPQYRENTVYFRHYISIDYCAEVIGVFNYKDGSMEEMHTTQLPEDTRLWSR